MTSLLVLASRPMGEVAKKLQEHEIRIESFRDDDYERLDRFIVSDRVVIERITGTTILRGIQEKSLFTSAIELRQQFEIPIFIFEGEVNYEYTGFHPQAVRGALTALVIVYGITVLSTPNIEETSALITMITRQEQSGVPEISLIPKRKANTLLDMQRRVVEMLPGCGVATAKDLLQYFGSVENIVLAGEEELCQVRGIGPAKAAEIIRVTHSEYAAVEVERHLEDAIAVSPKLLFEGQVELVDRQHYMYSDSAGRNYVDMIFHDSVENIVYMVELKLGKLLHEHYLQLRKYLNHAEVSLLVGKYIRKGAAVRGILVSIETSKLMVSDEQVTIRIVNKDKVIETLNEIRSRRGRIYSRSTRA